MKKSELTFLEGFTTNRAEEAIKQGKTHKSFDWDKAALIIKTKLNDNPNLVAEAGLQGDWDYTGGVIFENGKPTNERYTFLGSNWAIPTLEIDGEHIECFVETNDRFHAETKWDKQSLQILGIELND